MSVSRIEATIRCDGCNAKFTVDLDAAYKPPAGWSLFDVAEDAVRGGVLGHSVQDSLHLCRDCTRTVDAIETPNDRNATADEIRVALNK